MLKAGAGSVLSMGLGVLAMKVLALVLGPSGVGLFSVLRQTQQVGVTLSVFNGQMSIIQGVASREKSAQGQYLATVFWIVLLLTVATSLGLWLCSPWLASRLTEQGRGESPLMFRYLSVAVLFGAAQAFLTAVLNGRKAVGRVAWVQVISLGSMALLAYPAAKLAKSGHPFALSGILAASAMLGTVAAFGLLLHEGSLGWLFRSPSRRPRREDARSFLSMSGTLAITGLYGALIPLLVRAWAVQRHGLHGAGILDVAWTISLSYLMVILGSLSSYYLPTLSSTAAGPARAEVIGRMLRLILGFLCPIVVTAIVLKPVLLDLLYSRDFSPALKIMRWMMIGDFFKGVSWVFSFTMIAHSDMRTFLWSELTWGSATLAASAVFILGAGSLEGVGITYAALYVLYLLFTYAYAVRRYQFHLGSGTLKQGIVGACLVVAVSLWTWNDIRVSAWKSIAAITVAALVSGFWILKGTRPFEVPRALSSGPLDGSGKSFTGGPL